jgi:hypothetical protein
MTFTLAGCGPAAPTVQPTKVEQLPTPTVISPTSTFISPTFTLIATPIPSMSITPTPLDTLEPEKANEIIKTLLREPGDCSSPCFWGIVPGQTTVGEAGNILSHLGLQMASTTFEGKDFSAIHYDLDSGLSIEVILTIQNDFVENFRIKINPEKQKVGVAREWLAYSPETLIKRYGMPSRVDFVADWGPGPFFAMQMYFDVADLIVQYAGNEIIPAQKGSSQVCPQTVQFESVWLWMGKNPVYPPGKGVPLEKATSMTMEEFSKLMSGDPNHACFIFYGDVFQ